MAERLGNSWPRFPSPLSPSSKRHVEAPITLLSSIPGLVTTGASKVDINALELASASAETTFNGRNALEVKGDT